jgi:TorA maturation chaperone TorD
MTPEPTLDRPDAWADLLVVFAECLREPDPELIEALRAGRLRDAVADADRALSLQLGSAVDPPTASSSGALVEAHISLFGAMETPYAPSAESPYKRWYGGRSGLMGGPPAADMSRRYEAIDAEFPGGYPPDHVALLLEYGALLLDDGADEEFAAYVDAHLDWVPALRLATEGAAADAPFHRWAVRLLDDATAVLRARLGLDPVGEREARAMVDGIDDARLPRTPARR